MSRTKAADVRVYFDADILGLAKLLCRERTDFTYPGAPSLELHRRRRPECTIAPGAKDHDWIPLVANRNWLIIGRDRKIQQRPVELAAVRDSGARMINLAGEDAVNTWAQLEVFMTRWREIEALLDEPGPFIYQAHLTSKLRQISLTMDRPTRASRPVGEAAAAAVRRARPAPAPAPTGQDPLFPDAEKLRKSAPRPSVGGRLTVRQLHDRLRQISEREGDV